ncbi:hypothetical protein IMG5_100370 [Ichthyophthirius multifiliis]|uniref:Uncharacterized protein n=1 Tax=Ichthyophthirius multifiliis TaxID=5932 RepID=G0QSE1_ICHMU|nr:hypothetical protein IMG5_100370 [Ichthyophthirius multifiliis]EGR31888.1 hypothetical protein IMG5_100370 [Ichthyophthirius multifiliis]|eukprot:XP_004035374.1 hypothetical protein IMG5_100370 [Ichthyophthirius multifiliis]
MKTLNQNDKEFCLKSLEQELRLDGRTLLNSRKIEVHFGLNPGEIELISGDTHIATKTHSSITDPKKEKPNEGFLFFKVDLSSTQDEQQQNLQNFKEYSNEIQKLLEKIIKGSKQFFQFKTKQKIYKRAIDVASLCIITGKKVWNITVETSVISNGGNLIDNIYLCVMISLLHFRKPYISIEQQSKIKIHPDKNPQPLSIHHMPIPFTFALFKNATLLVADPLAQEEQLMEGRITISVNIYNDICNIHKPGGAPLKLDVIDKQYNYNQIFYIYIFYIFRIIQVCLNKIKKMTGFVREITSKCAQYNVELIKQKNQIIIMNFDNPQNFIEGENNKIEEENNDAKQIDQQELQMMLEK